ncbi:hypothetical protein BBJ29_003872 [Phytophthora kernoviae]|uniref:ABC transporter domain-containing protein n=1 Tax=Phytophthora kernoviae TaxID=325452 RepID=A0A3F2S1G3_9STRA|nr:hypothetical protein BBP00_00000968 [Phytophthora kernoviae]RLN70026.1 hypothetical protein BBJ29_003872 [Phytophthora kernoviae]
MSTIVTYDYNYALYIKFVSTTTTTMVIEKETRIREVMKIMGLSNFTLLCSWCLTTALLATPLAFIIAAELKYGQVFPMTEYATLVFLFWALSLSIVSFSYFITPFFNKSRAASIASVLLWLVLFFPFFSVMSKSNSSKYLGALAPPTAFALGIDDLVRRAQLGRGLAYAMGLVESPITVPTAFSMSWFLILDSFILVVLGWYFDNVLPQEFGVRKPWNFLFVKEYWLPSSSTRDDKELLVLESPNDVASPQTNYAFASPRGVAARNLSGGQKRKLSVALAFMGDSKLVFLDEPTSGMDPYSRRFTWNLLQRNRDDRVIVLTTHFMDEADILGDRIAIMADGQLCCVGSSLYLKNRYGAGYNLTMIKGMGYCLDQDGAKLQATLNAFLTSVVLMLAFAFVPAAIVAFVVREKNPNQNAKGLQLICGANVSAYWMSTWTHDIILMLVTVIASMIMVPLSDRTLSSASEVQGVVALVGSHALAVIPMAYLFSFRFKKHAVAQTSLLVFALCTGGLLSIFSFLCRLVDFDLTPDNSTDNLTLSSLDRNYLRWIFLLFPGYSLNNGIYEIATRKLSRNSLYGSSGETIAPPSFFGLWKGLGTDYTCTSCWEASSGEDCCVRNVFDLDVAGAPVAYAVVEIVIFMVLVFAVENKGLSWRPERRQQWSHSEDDDVAKERQKVEQSYPTDNDSVFIRNLRQQYGHGGKVALDDLCLSISKGECFGYLGINGAGKSTTMKVLTGEIAPTNGFVTLGGYDLSKDRDKARRVVGYCPQFDSLHDLLTVEEQLELYARLKGIPSDRVKMAVDKKIEEVGLEEYRTKLTRGLSGGNKRKLSTAIALIGSPSIIFLDEPSTGVDPSSRRKMWDVIASVCAAKESSVILTTHSMEECEALCTRVGILVSGQLKCLGSVEHLKQKFGRGYIVEVKLREPNSSSVGRLKLEVYRILGGNSPGISPDNVINLCSSLGVSNRAHEIMNGEGNGGVLHSYLETSGIIPINVFCSWWHSENAGSALLSFFETKFPSCELVEHQGSHFRFQVPKQSLRPYAIFGLLEESREQLQVSEYGVSETSLEHIFNTMAAQQGEEQLLGSARYRGDW